MAYATRSRASRVKREADSSAEAAQVEVDHDGEGDHAGGDALSVEGSDAPELAYGLSTATRPESEQEEGDEMNVDEEGDEDGSDGSDNSDSSSEASYDSRSEGELEDTAAEMRELETAVELNGTFVLVDRLGEGTFSSVYKAIDMHHAAYDNSQWTKPDNEQLPTPAPTSSTDGSEGRRKKKQKKVYVALKRIYVTSSPQRIQNELDILAKLRGCRNVAYLVSAFRHEDQVIAVMPYEKHQDFRDFYRTASISLIRSYFTCLFRGMADAHELGIIHRDVKPANFLYNVYTGVGTLCDFGLAQVFDPLEWHGHCLHSLPQTKAGLPHGVRMERPLSLYDQVADGQKKYGDAAWKPEDEDDILSVLEVHEENADFYDEWERACYRAPGRVGYPKPETDKRPSARANRAGTRGFRAPEVLFKCSDQTVSIDIWSVGIMLLCFLTRRFPFFNSNDDIEALMEIGTIFGKKRLEMCGALHNRVFTTNVPSVETPVHHNLHELVRSLNPNIIRENRPPGTPDFDVSWYDGSELFACVDLMKKCLALDCTRRITAAQALQHAFFTAFPAQKA